MLPEIIWKKSIKSLLKFIFSLAFCIPCTSLVVFGQLFCCTKTENALICHKERL